MTHRRDDGLLRQDGEPHWLLPVLLVLGAGAVSQGLARFALAACLPAMTQDLLGSYTAAGWMGAANLGAYFLGVLVQARMPSSIDPGLILRIGLLVTTASMLVVGLAPNVWIVGIGTALGGFFGAAVWMQCSAIVAGHTPSHRRGLAFGMTTAGIGGAIAITSALAAWAARADLYSAWRPVWLIEAGIAALILVANLLFLPPTRRPPSTSSRMPLDEVLPGWRRLLASYFLYGASYSLFTSFLVEALHVDVGLSVVSATHAYSLLGLAAIFGGLVLGRVSDVLGRKQVLSGAILITGLAAFVVPLGSLGVTWPVIPAALAFGLSMSGMGTVLMAHISDLAPAGHVSQALATVTLGFGIAQFLVPPVGGHLADALGRFGPTYVVAALLGVAAAFFAAILPTHSRTLDTRPAMSEQS
ncbi:MAG: YbfB/YjiJ family MFS transporter [Nostocoides sp.]